MECWNYRQLVIEDNLVLFAVEGGYISGVLDSILTIETSINYMMQSSRFWCAANKQFKDE